MSRPMPALATLSLAAALAPATVAAAESYENCTGFIDSVPAIISTQGTWCLRKDLATSITFGSAILVETNNVTIDCNGFKLGGLSAGPSTNATGVRAINRLNGTVRNCGIRGFYRGIFFEGTSGGGHLVEDNRLDQNIGAGILADGAQNLVRRNRVLDTVATAGNASGIYVAGDAFDNTVDVVEGPGLAYGMYVFGFGVVAARNQVRGIGGGTNSIGISTEGIDISVLGNQVIKVPEGTGQGIWGSGATVTHCRDNIVSGWTTAALLDCGNAGGNYLP